MNGIRRPATGSLCLLGALLLVACGSTVATPTSTLAPTELPPTDTPTEVPTDVPTVMPSDTLAPTATETPPPIATPTPVVVPVAADTVADLEPLDEIDLAREVRQVAVSGRATILAAATGDGVMVVDLVTFETESLDGGESAVAIAAGPTGELLTGAYEGGLIQVWDDSGTILETMYEDEIGSLALNPAGDVMAVGGMGTIPLLDIATGEEIAALQTGFVTHALRFSPDGSLLATSTSDERIVLWDPAEARSLNAMTHPGIAGTLAFSGDGVLLASGGGDGSARVWDVISGSQFWLLETDSEVLSVAFHPDGTMLAAGSADGVVRVWNILTGDLLAEFEAAQPSARQTAQPGTGVRGLAWSPGGAALISIGGGGRVVVWGLP